MFDSLFSGICDAVFDDAYDCAWEPVRLPGGGKPCIQCAVPFKGGAVAYQCTGYSNPHGRGSLVGWMYDDHVNLTITAEQGLRGFQRTLLLCHGCAEKNVSFRTLTWAGVIDYRGKIPLDWGF
jgi:hypothetical protein